MQTTGVDVRQAKAVSFLFSLLIEAVKKLSQPEKDSQVASEDQLCDFLELVVDKWLVEQVFLNDQWLAEAEHDSLSIEQKKGRKSGESSQMQTSVDYLCSSEIVELLHLAIESCSKFQLSPVVRLAVMKMFGGSKILLEKTQHNGALGRACACTVIFPASAHTWTSTQSTFQKLNVHIAAYPMWAKIPNYSLSALTLILYTLYMNALCVCTII